jgi:hypothetical protein
MSGTPSAADDNLSRSAVACTTPPFVRVFCTRVPCLIASVKFFMNLVSDRFLKMRHSLLRGPCPDSPQLAHLVWAPVRGHEAEVTESETKASAAHSVQCSSWRVVGWASLQISQKRFLA